MTISGKSRLTRKPLRSCQHGNTAAENAVPFIDFHHPPPNSRRTDIRRTDIRPPRCGISRPAAGSVSASDGSPKELPHAKITKHQSHNATRTGNQSEENDHGSGQSSPKSSQVLLRGQRVGSITKTDQSISDDFDSEKKRRAGCTQKDRCNFDWTHNRPGFTDSLLETAGMDVLLFGLLRPAVRFTRGFLADVCCRPGWPVSIAAGDVPNKAEAKCLELYLRCQAALSVSAGQHQSTRAPGRANCFRGPEKNQKHGSNAADPTKSKAVTSHRTPKHIRAKTAGQILWYHERIREAPIHVHKFPHNAPDRIENQRSTRLPSCGCLPNITRFDRIRRERPSFVSHAVVQ